VGIIQLSLSSEIAETFSLTSIEASELERKALALADAFKGLRSAYSIDYLTESKAYAEKNKLIMYKTGVRALFGKATNILSGGASKMWQRYKACDDAHRDFTAVCQLHSVPASVEHALTQTLELAHEQSRLRQAEEVAEGRRLFESLRSAKSNPPLHSFLKI